MTKGKATGAVVAAPASTEEAVEKTLGSASSGEGLSLESLKAGVDMLTADRQKLEAENKELNSQIVQLLSKNEALKARLEDAEAELEDAAKTLEELKAQLNVPASGKVKGPVVEIGDQKYLITSGIRIKGKVFTADDVAADEDLVKSLIEKGSTIPQLID